MVCFYVGRDQKIFVSPENYGDWRSARSRSTSFAGRLGRDQKVFHLQRTMEIGDQRGRGAASLLGTTVATCVEINHCVGCISRRRRGRAVSTRAVAAACAQEARAGAEQLRSPPAGAVVGSRLQI